MDPALMVNVVANHHAHTDLVTGEGANMEVACLGNVLIAAVVGDFAPIPPVTARPHANMDLVTGECANMEIAFLGNVRMMTAMVAFAHIKIVLAVAATAVVREAPVSMIGVLMASVTTFTTTV